MATDVGPGRTGLSWWTKVSVGAVIVVPNVVGATVVLLLAAFVLPTRRLVADESGAITRNLVVFGVYVAAAVLVCGLWGLAAMRVPRPPDPADVGATRRHQQRARRVVLRGPVRLAAVQTVPWLIACVLFVGLNLQYSAQVALTVGCVVALGGVATVAVAYRLSELALRREVARVLTTEPPRGLRLPGVAIRSLGAWTMGTGVPLLGVCLAAAASLVFADYYTVERLGVVVLVLAGTALVVGFLVTALTAASISAPVVAVRRALGQVEKGRLDVTVRVSDTTELGVLQAGFNTMVTGLRERDRVRDLFTRQVGEDVARAAIESDLELGGEVREVAVLFVDLVGSTRLAYERPPQEVVAVLNAFFGVVVAVVEEHGGWINKFEGDAALAVFGVPSPLEDPAAAALRAARDLARRLDDGAAGVRAGIGVSAGPAVAGNIGDERRYEYTVIGDPVNEAARLSELAKDREGLVAASGAALARADEGEGAHWRTVDAVRLRGREADTEIAVPQSREPDRPALARAPVHRAVPPGS